MERADPIWFIGLGVMVCCSLSCLACCVVMSQHEEELNNFFTGTPWWEQACKEEPKFRQEEGYARQQLGMVLRDYPQYQEPVTMLQKRFPEAKFEDLLEALRLGQGHGGRTARALPELMKRSKKDRRNQIVPKDAMCIAAWSVKDKGPGRRKQRRVHPERPVGAGPSTRTEAREDAMYMSSQAAQVVDL